MALPIDFSEFKFELKEILMRPLEISIPIEWKVDDNDETTYYITYNYGNYKKENKCMTTE